MRTSEVQQRIEKDVFASLIIPFELFVVNSNYYKKNSCHGQSMC